MTGMFSLVDGFRLACLKLGCLNFGVWKKRTDGMLKAFRPSPWCSAWKWAGLITWPSYRWQALPGKTLV